MTAAGLLLGVQAPRFVHSPSTAVENFADEAIELCAEAGMPLDPWQRIALESMLGVRADGAWAARTAGVTVSRQNGKGAILEARELAAMFLFEEPRIVHSAHQAATADEAFKRMRNLIEGVPWLDSEVAKILGSPGRQSIRLKNGSELSYRTRTRGGGRGFSAPLVILDEAQELTGDQLAAIRPLVSSFPSHQLIYTGTVQAGATVFQGVVERGRQRIGDSLGYVEWSAPEDCESDDVDAWLMANPSIGYRMTLDAVQTEWEEFSAAKVEDRFREERLSIWPALGGAGSVIPVGPWAAGETGFRPDAKVSGGIVAVAVSMDREYAIVGYGLSSPKGVYVEGIAETGGVDRFGNVRVGIDWVLPFLVELQSRRRPEKVVVDKAGPAASLLNAMIAAGLPVLVTELADWKAACAQFVDSVVAGRIEHSGQPAVTEAAQGVQWRVVGDSRVYDRKSPGVRVAPLEAVTLAAWGVAGTAKRPSKYETGDLLVF